MILPEYDEQCGWYEMLGPASDFPPLENDATYPTVVIGGGFLGMAAARRLAENRPDNPVLLIEALKIGHGASGRNSGFVIDQPHKRDLELGSSEHKRKTIRLNREAIAYLQTQIDNYGIKCQWSAAGKYQAAVGARGEKFLSVYEQLLRDEGEPYEVLTGDALKGVFGTEFYSRAVYTPGGMLMQPAALIRGLSNCMPDNVRIAEHTPVVKMERTSSGFTIHSDKAVIHCENIILGTNVFTAEFGYLRNRILPIMTFASMTRPLTDAEMLDFGGQLDWGITPADHGGTTLRMTQDRRLLIRNSYRYADDYNTPEQTLPKVRKHHRESFLDRYPNLENVEFEYTWGGTSSLSRNFQSFFGEVEPGIYTACCDQSVGTARGTITGMLLADTVCNKPSDLLKDMHQVAGCPSWLPPKPLLKIGVPIRLGIARIASRSEV